MNQPKNKVKQPLQTSSKLLELENKLLEEGNMLKYDTNNLLDGSQNDEYNGHSKTLVCSKNKDDISLLEVKESKPIAQGNVLYFYLIIITNLKLLSIIVFKYSVHNKVQGEINFCLLQSDDINWLVPLTLL